MAQPAAAPAFDAFDALPDPAAILAADGAMLRANPVFRTTFRHWIGPNRPPWGRAATPKFLNGERRFDATAPDGRRFEWVERILPDGARLCVARDISRHTRAAEDALRSKTTLFATLTHELRTPLNGILGMAGLLDLGNLEANERTYVAAIRQSGEHLLDLITEILDYARLEAGRVELETAPFDPEATMQDVAELLSPKAHDKGLELAVILRGATPARVIGDEGRLRQILFNLAGNAVKFTESGGVVFELAVRPGGRLRFNVRDTGPGVAADKQTQIFEEFAQADAGVARRHGGAGLGLAIVKKLARAMGGEAGVVSKPGFGASFWVELPLSTAEDLSNAAPSLQGVRVAVMAESPVLTQALRAATASLAAELVDDNADVLLCDWREDLDAEAIADLKGQARALIMLIPQERRDASFACRAAGAEHYRLKRGGRRPLAEGVRVALGDAPAGAATDVFETEAPRLLAGLKVLVAEDNPLNARLARTLLTRAGCAVTLVHDGAEAGIIDLPAPGGPTNRILCAPAAAISSARLACSCPRTSRRSGTAPPATRSPRSGGLIAAPPRK
jgi:signal transduction histidine kinase